MTLDDHLRIIKLLLDLVTRLKSQDCRAKAGVPWVNGWPEPPSETLSRKKKGRQGGSVGKRRLPHKPGNLSLSPKSHIKVEGEKPAPLTSRYNAHTHAFTSLSASVGGGGIHVYKLPWVCARLWGSACAHRDQSLPSCVLLFCSYSHRTWSSLLSDAGWPVDARVRWSLPPQSWDRRGCSIRPIFMWVLRIWIQDLSWQTLYRLNHLPKPDLTFKS